MRDKNSSAGAQRENKCVCVCVCVCLQACESVGGLCVCACGKRWDHVCRWFDCAHVCAIVNDTGRWKVCVCVCIYGSRILNLNGGAGSLGVTQMALVYRAPLQAHW